MLKCVNVSELIRETTLDMMEERPFYKIKVSDLTNTAHIGRSTFYLHYDSIYDVVEEIENDFIRGLQEESASMSAYADSSPEDYAQAALQIEMMNAAYIREHARTFRLLTGPNGDPSFNHKLVKRTREYLDQYIRRTGSGTRQDRYYNLLSEFMINGNLAFQRCITAHPEMYSDDEIAIMHRRISEQLLPLLTEKLS